MGVEPSDISDEHVEAYVTHRRETSFKPLHNSQVRALTRHINQYAQTIRSWPATDLTVPPVTSANTGPSWDELPAGLRADIEALLERRARPRKSASGRRLRRCKPSTLERIRRQLRAAIGKAVSIGINLEELSSLQALLHPDYVERILDAYWQNHGDHPGTYTIELATLFLGLARSETGLDENALERLEGVRAALEEHRQTGLTKKNMELIRQVLTGDTWPKVIALPRRMMAEANALHRSQPVKSAVTAQLAVAIRLLSVAPVRIRNLATIRIGENLVRPGGPGAPYHLVFPPAEVKNEQALEFPLSADVTGMIDNYIRDHRPVLMRGHNHDFLFPGEAGSHKGTKTLGEQLSKRIGYELGLAITAHQFRHAAAAIILRADPGNYEFVRRVLGHTSLETTTRFYIGLETLAATKRYGEIVTGMIAPNARESDARKRRG